MPADRTHEGKTRSRAGCLTCRGRHKKCDETRLPEHRGACRRCFTGSWDCQWPVPPGDKPLRSFVSGSKRTQAKTGTSAVRKASLSSAGGGDSLPDDTMGGPGPLAVPPVPPPSSVPAPAPYDYNAFPHAAGYGAPPVSSVPFLPSSSSTPSSSLPISALLPPVHPVLDVTTPNAYSDLDVLAPASSFSAFLAPPEQLGDDLSHFFSSLDAEAGYWDSLQAQAHTSSAAASDVAMSEQRSGSADMYAGAGLTPLAEAHAAEQAERDLQKADEKAGVESATAVEDASVQALLLRAGETGGASDQTTATTALAVEGAGIPAIGAATAQHKDKKQRRVAPPPVQKEQTDEPVSVEDSDPVQVDPIYNTFNNGFFRSLPKPVREVVVQKAYNVAGSSDLSRHAAMAMVMLYRLRMQQQAQQTSAEPVSAAEVAATAEQHAKLLAQSDHYFQKALEHLQAPIPFEAKMVAILDMQNYQFDQWGAAASNAILLLGEYFINEALGSQPAIDLSDMRDPKNVLLSAVAWSDCVRCICIPRRRTIFAFSGLPGEPSATTPEAVVSNVSSHSNSIDAHLGLPLGLLLCVAATANLSAEMDALPDEVVKVKAAAIENAIREWKPAPPNLDDLADSAWFIDKLSTAEMWRHAVVIFLYQAVHRHGPLSRVIREAMQQILQLGSRMLQQYRAPLSSVVASHQGTSATAATAMTAGAAAAGTATSGPGSTTAAAVGDAPASSTAAPTNPAAAVALAGVRTGSAVTSGSAPTGVAVPGGAGETEEYLSAPSMRAVPWFLAGTCAQLPSDRALCRRGIECCGRQQGYRDNIAALERIWEVTDEKGWTVDWRNLLQSEQRFVGWL